MLFDEKFLDSLTNDPIAGTIQICNAIHQSQSDGAAWQNQDYLNLLEAYTLLSEMAEANILPVDHIFSEISPSLDWTKKCGLMSGSIIELTKKCEAITEAVRVEKLRTKFKTALGSGFRYEFSQGDLEKVQELINELRQEVSGCDKLADEHKARLLKRLEALQSELHKKISDLDKFFGLVSDASVVMAKIGNNAKPIVDRVREIADIVWRTQARAEELPSGTALPQIGQTQTKQPPRIDT